MTDSGQHADPRYQRRHGPVSVAVARELCPHVEPSAKYNAKQHNSQLLALRSPLTCVFFFWGGGFRYYEKYVDLDVTLNTVEVLSKLIEVRAFLFRFVRM